MRGTGIRDKFLSVLAVHCNPGGVSKMGMTESF